ncbi:MAG: helix-hairpin-helix domain-containing protein [Atopobiaceae bacterium]|nr:helix-hairpin-helix domain-containing protein [Atopobiaceae bacterium]
MAPANNAAAPRSLDANSCSTTDLLALPNMNASTARAIVSEREAHGPYQSIEELIARNDLKPHVVVSFISHLYVVVPSAMPTSSQHVRRLDL